ncbi:MAG: molecular chaperone HtpG [Chlamydiae bacterium CG10_big_fil_rev_8_21_14_0_10_42_34]|nr:MAG: molecular chaperone HtpG [Chlamydiae bacterium CG10_big_fil_rev_8_21_14_0_10_42_34]
MRQNNLSIHSENILPIIKKWLYSDKDIFLRELVSNACDALNKVRIIQGDVGDFKISIAVDKENKTITIADTGIGMTEDEVEKYIAQIAFSGAEEFVEKYKSQTDKDPIIGHFGLGFYSAYMVASKVEIDTLSYKEGSSPVFWSCDGSSSYTIDTGTRKERGTTITLHVNDPEYLEETKLRQLLDRHCNFMPFPIDLNSKPIGNQEPLWLKAPSECTEKEYLAFYRQLFPLDPEPIFWIHLNVDYPFHLQGILFFPKIHRRFDANESTIKLFCSRVFVSDNCKDILPDYLMILRGAIDSPDIPLNVSRSYLQVDKNVRQLSSHISKKVSDKLCQLYKNDREKFIASWPDIEMIVKLGILQDEKFYDRVKEILIWKNSEGNWTTIGDNKKVLYSTTENSPLHKLYKSEILFATTPIDTAVIQHLESKLDIKFQRVDGALDESLLDPSREKTLLDADGKTESAHIADFIRSALVDVEVEAKSLSSDQLPGLVILDENQRRFRDYISLTQGQKGIDTKKTFVVNTNNKLIQTITKLHKKQPEVASEIAKSLYDLSLLSQREIDPANLEDVVTRQTEILEKMSTLLV